MKPIKVFAAFNNERNLRLSSSSGAIFSSLAENVLKKKGVVYGVKMSDDCYFAEFTRVTDTDGLIPLRGSKYLQAKVGNAFKQVKKDLLLGKMVLFSGTGCQVNGLKKYLGKEYDNLLCVDVICHGVPSPALWKKYAQYQEKKNDGKLENINFRCKDDNWIDFGVKEVLNNASKKKDKKLFIPKDKDPYMQMFLRDYCLRPSCYNCVAKKVKTSDITIADFWGIENVYPKMNDGLGTSLAIVRTENGLKLFEEIKEQLNYVEVSYEDGVKCNLSEYKSVSRPIQRESFFVDMNNMDFDKLQRKYTFSYKRAIKDKIKAILKMPTGGAKRRNMYDYGLLFLFKSR